MKYTGTFIRLVLTKGFLRTVRKWQQVKTHNILHRDMFVDHYKVNRSSLIGPH